MNSCPRETGVSFSTRQILGIKFFNGDVDQAVALMVRHGGFLVAPSGTCFTRLQEDEPYRRAMLAADLAIADSSLMVLTWRLLRREKIRRVSGLRYLQYLQQLLARIDNHKREHIVDPSPLSCRQRMDHRVNSTTSTTNLLRGRRSESGVYAFAVTTVCTKEEDIHFARGRT